MLLRSYWRAIDRVDWGICGYACSSLWLPGKPGLRSCAHQGPRAEIRACTVQTQIARHNSVSHVPRAYTSGWETQLFHCE